MNKTNVKPDHLKIMYELQTILDVASDTDLSKKSLKRVSRLVGQLIAMTELCNIELVD